MELTTGFGRRSLVYGLWSMVFGSLLMSGCHAAMRVAEFPRVDLQLSEGNRGYLIGTPPEAAQVNTTRQMLQTDIEVPSFYRPKRTGGPVTLEENASAEPPPGEAHAPSRPPGSVDRYVVQQGDSLWSIAAKPEIYGKATRWRSILDANRDALNSNPNRLRAGMVLEIPRGASGREAGTTYSDEGVTYKK